MRSVLVKRPGGLIPMWSRGGLAYYVPWSLPTQAKMQPSGWQGNPALLLQVFFSPLSGVRSFFFSFLSFSRSPLFPPCSGLGEGGEDHDGKRKRRKKKMTSPHYTTPDHCPPTLTTSLFLFSSLFLVPLLPRSCTQT